MFFFFFVLVEPLEDFANFYLFFWSALQGSTVAVMPFSD